MVIVFDAQTAVTPAGNPVARPMPVALTVVCVIFVRGELTHKVGVEDATSASISRKTVIDPVALTTPQPPISGI